MWRIFCVSINSSQLQSRRVNMCDVAICFQNKYPNFISKLIKSLSADIEYSRCNFRIEQLSSEYDLWIRIFDCFPNLWFNFLHVVIGEETQIQPMIKQAETHMDVGIDETWQHCFTFQIDDLSIFIFVCHDFLGCAHLENLISLDSHSLNSWIPFIHGINGTISKNIADVLAKINTELNQLMKLFPGSFVLLVVLLYYLLVNIF